MQNSPTALPPIPEMQHSPASSGHGSRSQSSSASPESSPGGKWANKSAQEKWEAAIKAPWAHVAYFEAEESKAEAAYMAVHRLVTQAKNLGLHERLEILEPEHKAAVDRFWRASRNRRNAESERSKRAEVDANLIAQHYRTQDFVLNRDEVLKYGSLEAPMPPTTGVSFWGDPLHATNVTSSAYYAACNAVFNSHFRPEVRGSVFSQV